MAITVGTTEPVCFTIGDTVSWTRFEPDYLPATWNLVYGFSGPSRFTIETVDDGTKHKATMIATGLLPGDYVWIVKATNGTDTITLDRGTMRAVPDLTAADAELDAAEARLAVVEAAYTNLAGGAFTSVSVDGVAFTRGQTSDLKSILMFCRREVQRLRANRAILLGQRGGDLHLTRFLT